MSETERIKKLEEQIIRLSKEKAMLTQIVRTLTDMILTMMKNPVVFEKNKEIETDKEIC